MKNSMYKFLFAVVLMITLGSVALTLYGLFLGFSAHVLIGVLHLVIAPLSFITGFTEFFFSYDISQAILSTF
jgi:hypothetical protein